MTTYTSAIDAVRALKAKFGDTWSAISPEDAASPTAHREAETAKAHRG